MRNLVVHGESIQDLMEVFQWCKCFLSDLHNCEDRNPKPPFLPGNVRIVWSPLDPNCFKINCDAAVDRVGGRIGIGIVIMDHSGFILASCS